MLLYIINRTIYQFQSSSALGTLPFGFRLGFGLVDAAAGAARGAGLAAELAAGFRAPGLDVPQSSPQSSSSSPQLSFLAAAEPPRLPRRALLLLLAAPAARLPSARAAAAFALARSTAVNPVAAGWGAGAGVAPDPAKAPPPVVALEGALVVCESGEPPSWSQDALAAAAREPLWLLAPPIWRVAPTPRPAKAPPPLVVREPVNCVTEAPSLALRANGVRSFLTLLLLLLLLPQSSPPQSSSPQLSAALARLPLELDPRAEPWEAPRALEVCTAAGSWKRWPLASASIFSL